MSRRLIARSPSLKALQDEGYDIQVIEGYLVIQDVPYVNEDKEIRRGSLISKLVLAGDRAEAPDDHTMLFDGEYPCDKTGVPLDRIRHSEPKTFIRKDLTGRFMFSAKPQPSGRYENYYDKMTTYVALISGPAEALGAPSAKTFPVVTADEEESVFRYIDTATSRAEIVAISKKLEVNKVAIVGLGGTGSYVLDLLAKTPVKEIHLFDGDKMLQHNAFRSPGAPSEEELNLKPMKVSYFADIYGKMRRAIHAHPDYITPANLHELEGMDFVFICMEGPDKEAIVDKLDQNDIPFVDVGMGLYAKNDALGGLVRTTSSIPGRRDHIRGKKRIPFSKPDAFNEYTNNIQIADLNALNATYAVIKWKKMVGFYHDLEKELHSVYAIGTNDLSNEDKP